MSFRKFPQRLDGDASSPHSSTRSIPRTGTGICIFRTDAKENIAHACGPCQGNNGTNFPQADQRADLSIRSQLCVNIKRPVHKIDGAEPLDRKKVLPCSGSKPLANRDRPACHTALRLLPPLVRRVTLVTVARLAQQRASGALVRSCGVAITLYSMMKSDRVQETGWTLYAIFLLGSICRISRGLYSTRGLFL